MLLNQNIKHFSKRGLKSLLLLLLIRLCHEAEQGDPGAPGQETESETTDKSHSKYEGSRIQSSELGANPAPHVQTNVTEIMISEQREDVRCTTHSTVDDIKDTERGKETTNTDTNTEMTVKHVLVSSLDRDKRDGGG